jgi:pimeloyl-ACP methyl ester carboxylesterase
MRSLFVLFIGLLAFSTYSRAEFVETKLLRLDSSEITFYLDQPTSGSFPIILFLQGSECHSVMGRNNMPSNPSASFGTGFLMIEKFGITKKQDSENDDENCTADFLRSNTLDQRVIDALKVISYLRDHAPNWNRNLLIIGGSEGGMLAPILASLIPETKKVAMLVAGNGRTMLEDTRGALALTARKRGLGETQVTSILAEYDLRTAEIKNDPSPEKMYLGHPYKWWNSVLWVKPVNWMVDLSLPQLLVHGTADTSVPVESARATVEIFNKAGKTNLTYLEAKNCDHALIDSDGVSHKMEYLLKSIRWLLE